MDVPCGICPVDDADLIESLFSEQSYSDVDFLKEFDANPADDSTVSVDEAHLAVAAAAEHLPDLGVDLALSEPEDHFDAGRADALDK
jgi:hypothetical protein